MVVTKPAVRRCCGRPPGRHSCSSRPSAGSQPAPRPCCGGLCTHPRPRQLHLKSRCLGAGEVEHRRRLATRSSRRPTPLRPPFLPCDRIVRVGMRRIRHSQPSSSTCRPIQRWSRASACARACGVHASPHPMPHTPAAVHPQGLAARRLRVMQGLSSS